MKAGRVSEGSKRRASKTAGLGLVSRRQAECIRAYSRAVRPCSSCRKGWRRVDLRPELTLAVSLIALLALTLCCLEDSPESPAQVQ